MNHSSDAAVHFTSSAPAVRAVVNGFPILLLGDTYALRLLVPNLERCESREPLRIGRDTRRQIGRRELSHPSRVGSTRPARLKPAGSRELTQISIATSPDPNIRRH